MSSERRCCLTPWTSEKILGAGDRDRTDDIQLGKPWQTIDFTHPRPPVAAFPLLSLHDPSCISRRGIRQKSHEHSPRLISGRAGQSFILIRSTQKFDCSPVIEKLRQGIVGNLCAARFSTPHKLNPYFLTVRGLTKQVGSSGQALPKIFLRPRGLDQASVYHGRTIRSVERSIVAASNKSKFLERLDCIRANFLPVDIVPCDPEFSTCANSVA